MRIFVLKISKTNRIIDELRAKWKREGVLTDVAVKTMMKSHATSYQVIEGKNTLE